MLGLVDTLLLVGMGMLAICVGAGTMVDCAADWGIMVGLNGTAVGV